MMQVIDYIFYRKYVEHKKADDDPGFSTTWLFSVVLALYFGMPILILYDHFHIGIIAFLLTGAAIITFWMIVISRKYNRKKLKELHLKYRYHKWNRSIKDWMLNWGIVLFCITGIFTIVLWRYFLKFIGLI
jgi:Ca2+/Na+ antiporter